jgi:hypothetical protein
MMLIGMQENFGTEVRGLDREATFGVALRVLPVGVVNKDKVR